MKSFKEFVTEEKKADIHTEFKKMGMKDRTHDSVKYLEREYSANHSVKDVHAVLIKHGYRMRTHTNSGHPMDPHVAYEKPAAYAQNSANLHHKDGKIHYVTFNFRGDNS